MRKFAALAAVGLAMLNGCLAEGELDDLDDPDALDENIGEIEEEGRVVNGRLVNGRLINGRLVNGTNFSGMVKAAKLDHVKIGATYYNGVKLTNSSFASADGTKTGAAFVGAQFDGLVSDGNLLTLRIDTRRQLATDLFYYKVSYQTQTAWVPLCGTVGGVAVEAVPLAGVWNYGEGVTGGGSRGTVAGQFTFACMDTALGKCVGLGYVPWRTKNLKQLTPYHDACTRAVRADYCGDGRTFTNDGNLVNMYDWALVQLDTEWWAFEAGWNAAGAPCVKLDRVTWLQSHGVSVPACVVARGTNSCAWNNGALIATELP